MRVSDVLEQPGLRLPVLAGGTRLDRPVRTAYTTDLLDPSRYLAGGELVLTGLMWRRGPADSEDFVATLVRAGVAAIGAGEALLGCVPADLVDACRRHGLPLFAVPEDTSFSQVIERVDSLLRAEREAGSAAARGRRRDLVAALAAGADLADVWPVDVPAWLISCTGRVIAGPSAGEESMETDFAAELAQAYLAAGSLPATAEIGQRRFHLAHPSLPDGQSWPAKLGASFVAGAAGVELDELVSLAALDHARQERALQVERRLAGQLVEAMRAVLAGPIEPAQLAAAAHACGLSLEDRYAVVIASLAGQDPIVAGLEEMVYPARVVTATADHAVAVVATADSRQLATGLRRIAAQLTAAAGTPALRVGVSRDSAVSGLPQALTEAIHAHRLAQKRSGRSSVVGCDDLDDLAGRDLLLATIPAGARRSFAETLVGPLVAHDATHHTELMRTLRSFLDCDGSWTRCARVMHLHVNTLRYRMQRVAALTGRDLDRFADRVDLYLALRLYADS